MNKVYIVKDNKNKEQIITRNQLKSFLNKNLQKKDFKERPSSNFEPCKERFKCRDKDDYVEKCLKHLSNNKFNEIVCEKFEIKPIIVRDSGDDENFVKLYLNNFSYKQDDLFSFRGKKNYYSMNLSRFKISLYVSHNKTERNGFFNFYHNGNSSLIDLLLKKLIKICESENFNPKQLGKSPSILMSSDVIYCFPKIIKDTKEIDMIGDWILVKCRPN